METILDELRSYAKQFDLYLAETREDVVAQCDADDLPEGITAAAFLPDHAVMQCVAFIKDGSLYRFGIESLDEDPADEVRTTLQDLIDMGDPRDIL